MGARAFLVCDEIFHDVSQTLKFLVLVISTYVQSTLEGTILVLRYSAMLGEIWISFETHAIALDEIRYMHEINRRNLNRENFGGQDTRKKLTRKQLAKCCILVTSIVL